MTQIFNKDFQITSRLVKTMIWFASIFLARRLEHSGKFDKISRFSSNRQSIFIDLDFLSPHNLATRKFG